MKLLPALALGAALVNWFIPSTANAYAIIDPPYPGGIIIYWGPSAGAAGVSYGEVFYPPYLDVPQSVLNDFRFAVDTLNTPFPFVAQVYAWGPSGPTGPALYTSGVLDTTSTLTPYTFFPNLTLTPGAPYLAFLTNEPDGVSLGGTGDGAMQASIMGNSGPFEYAEGDPTVGADWPMVGVGLLASFRADFSTAPIPEPFTLSLFAAGIAGVAVLRRRKKA